MCLGFDRSERKGLLCRQSSRVLRTATTQQSSIPAKLACTPQKAPVPSGLPLPLQPAGEIVRHTLTASHGLAALLSQQVKVFWTRPKNICLAQELQLAQPHQLGMVQAHHLATSQAHQLATAQDHQQPTTAHNLASLTRLWSTCLGLDQQHLVLAHQLDMAQAHHLAMAQGQQQLMTAHSLALLIR